MRDPLSRTPEHLQVWPCLLCGDHQMGRFPADWPIPEPEVCQRCRQVAEEPTHYWLYKGGRVPVVSLGNSIGEPSQDGHRPIRVRLLAETVMPNGRVRPAGDSTVIPSRNMVPVRVEADA